MPTIIGIGSAQTADPNTPIRYTTYSNPKAGYALVYPPEHLIPDGAAPNETSQHFVSPDGRVSLRTYVQPVDEGATLVDLYNQASTPTPNRTVTYRVLRDDWFVVSGYENGDVYYQRSLLDNGVLKSFQMRYPAELKPEFDTITAQISWSFRSLDTSAPANLSQQRGHPSSPGTHALIHLSVATNGVHAWEPPGPEIVIGEPVFWAYTVVNMGNVDLVNITMVDDQGTKITCPARHLSAGEAMSCIAQGTASPGLHTHHVSIHAEAPEGEMVTDQAASYYVGIEPAIQVPATTP